MSNLVVTAITLAELLAHLGALAREALDEAEQYDKANPPRRIAAAYARGRATGLLIAQAQLANLLLDD